MIFDKQVMEIDVCDDPFSQIQLQDSQKNKFSLLAVSALSLLYVCS